MRKYWRGPSEVPMRVDRARDRYSRTQDMIAYGVRHDDFKSVQQQMGL